MDLSFAGAGLSIGLAGLGISIGQGFLIYKAMEVIGKNPKMSPFYLTITVLGVALVESAGIYGLIIAFKILSTTFVDPVTAIGVGLAIGLSGLGAGVGEGYLVSGALESMNKDPDNKSKILTYMILFLALVESSAIYGLIIAFQLLTKLDISPFLSVGAGLAVGFAGLGVGIGEGLLSRKSLLVIGDKPELTSYLLPITVLGIALVESAAIYGLIISFSIINATNLIDPVIAIGAGLSVGLAGLGVGVGEGVLVSNAIESMGISRVNKTKILTYMILFLALVESSAIYGLIIGLQMLSAGNISGIGAIGAGLAVGLAGLGVGIGEGVLSGKSILLISKRPTLSIFLLTITILGIALVESAAIYGLIIAVQIISTPTISGFMGLGAGLGVGFAGIGTGIGEGYVASGAFEAMYRNPAYKTKILTYMILGIALVESASIYSLLVAFNILF
ncbi:MAG: ATP synthase F0 subunit C [Candidatus Gracilibacteria bacterium]|nr:ATP synthase F0 subunit C [Candidatus Gracilibacteria bacterium]